MTPTDPTRPLSGSEDESWRDPELLDALRNGHPIGSNGRARILDWYAERAALPPAALRERVNDAFDAVMEAIEERTITRTVGDRFLGHIMAIRSGLDAVLPTPADPPKALRELADHIRQHTAGAGADLLTIDALADRWAEGPPIERAQRHLSAIDAAIDAALSALSPAQTPFVHPRLGVAELSERWDPEVVLRPAPAPTPVDGGES